MDKKIVNILSKAIPVISIACALAQGALDHHSRDEEINRAVAEYMAKHQ